MTSKESWIRKKYVVFILIAVSLFTSCGKKEMYDSNIDKLENYLPQYYKSTVDTEITPEYTPLNNWFIFGQDGVYFVERKVEEKEEE